MYALAVVPLIRQLNDLAHQVWFADDASAGGCLNDLLAWWEKLNKIGPSFGYYPNAGKTWLVTKEEHLQVAQELFATHRINVTTRGHQYLGSAIGDENFLDAFLQRKVQKWVSQIHTLSQIAVIEPHAAYCGFTHGLKSTWSYLMRTTPGTCDALSPLEDTIRNEFLPALTGRSAITDQERELLSLPCRLGGLGIPDFTKLASSCYQASQDICSPVVDLILKSQQVLRKDTSTEQKRIKQRVKNKKRICDADKVSSLDLPDHLMKAAELAQNKGALSCPRGAFPTIWHNEIRNLTGILLTEVCHDVSLEPVLQPLGGEVLNHATSIRENEARVDVAAKDVWTHGQKAFFDVKVFNPFAKSNQKFALASCFTHHERQKKRAYEQRVVEVENGSFTPLIFSTTGGMGRLASIFYSRLVMMLSEKRQQPFSSTMGWMRCQLSFSLLRSSILCIRGSRSSHHVHDSQSPPTWPPTNHVWPPTKLIQVHSLTYNILSI